MSQFIPPHMVEAMTRSPDQRIRELALHNQVAVDCTRSARAALNELRPWRIHPAATTPDRKKHRVVHDAGKKPNLEGAVRRREGDPRTGDPDVDDVYRNTGTVLDFYRRVFDRISVDGKGLPLSSSVRYRQSPSQPMLGAYWYRQQKVMAYGEEIQGVLKRPAKALDVAGHEITHGVVEFTANFANEGEPGALNESFADVMGSLIKQWRKGQTAKQADWLIGDEIVFRTPTVRAIRSLKAPGTAYTDDPHMGSDQQVWHMRDKYTGPKDDGGVHINSGIPSHAFYRCAVAVGGRAWERVGPVWYDALLRLHPHSDFEDCARTTYVVAGVLHGQGSTVQRAVKAAWKAVGLAI